MMMKVFLHDFSGTGAVAIDNKIEQAMVRFLLGYFG
jgi:hypothetical protein